ncbi:MAG: SPASM domain-containing protein [Chloroflexota bacterium]
MSVLHNGDVILCCNDWEHRLVVGNLHITSIRTVWNSERLNNIRRSIVSGQARSVAPCSACSLA